MYVCKDCGCIFDEPELYSEAHHYGEGYAYEQFHGCPRCTSCGYTVLKEEWEDEENEENED